MPNIASLLDQLSHDAELGTCHYVLNLGNTFFSIVINPENQEQFWEGCQWTFTVLPQSYLHSPTVCHGLVTEILAAWTVPPSVKLYHSIDDIMLTSNSLTELKHTVLQLLAHLQSWGWAVNSNKIQGPGLSVKFLGVVWSGKTKVMPAAMIDKIKAFPISQKPKQLQEFLGLLGYWWVFIPHLTQLVNILYCLTYKGATWGREKSVTWPIRLLSKCWRPYKHWRVIESQAGDLDIHVTHERYAWGPWQW